MFKKTIKTTLIATILFFVGLNCVAPEAVKTDIQGIRNDMGQMKKLIDQKADNSVVAEQIGQVNNKIEQTTQVAEELSLWRKNIQAENIYYGGGGWIVLGTGVVVLIFVVAGFLLIRAFMRRGSMLNLITGAVQRVGKRKPETILAIKEQIHEEVKKGRCTHEHRKCLNDFTKKTEDFLGDKAKLDV